MYSTNIFFKKTLSLFLVIFLSLSFLIPQKTESAFTTVAEVGPSGWSTIVGAISEGASAVSGALTASSISSLVVKEYLLDTIVPFIREALIKALTASIVNWINNGFEGDPMFITDLEGFLLDVANEVSGQFINDMGLTNLCSSFKPQLLLQMSYRQSYTQRAQCTVLDVIDNFEAFQEDFEYGGWQAFVKILEPQNNYYGSSYIAADEHAARLALSVQINQTKLEWGAGFLSWEECTTVGDDFEGPTRPSENSSENSSDFVGPTQRKDCQINTPGSVIYEQLNKVLPTGLKNLELADEINEIIGALLTQVMKQALGSGQGGLRGTTGYGGAIGQFNEGFESGNNDSANNTISKIEKDIQTEIDYKNIKEDSLFLVNNTENTLQAVKSCYQQKANSGRTFTRISDTEFGDYGDPLVEILNPAEAQQKANNTQRAIDNQIRPYNDTENGTLVLDILTADANIANLTEIRQEIQDSGDIYELGRAIENYAGFTSNLSLHTSTDIVYAEFERDGYPGASTGQYSQYAGITRKMNALRTTNEQELDQCRSFR